MVLFAFAFTAYAYFHQGGGWNQNARFALTRALVESHRPWIDDHLVYAADGAKGSPELRRIPVRNGGFTDAGRTFALAWSGKDDALTPLASDAPADARRLAVDRVAASGDLAFAREHIHPNKAPGVSFAAVPGYAIVWSLERLAGIDPDVASVLNVNAWLTGALSVGLIAALGVVLFWRVALRLSAGRLDSALFATLAFAFGTLYFPFATMLLDHDLVAVALLASFLLAFDTAAPARLFGAGVCAGIAVVTSYLSLVAAACLFGYVMWRARRPAGALAYAAGAIPPLALLGAYNAVCFGTLVTTNYAWENPLFKDGGGGVLGLFAAPKWDVLAALLVSPMRGLFSGAPVLVLGVTGLVAMLRARPLRAEGVLFAAMIAHVLLFNMSFANWQGGWACGPRYLIPALPFLALPIAVVAPRAPWVRRGLLAFSVAAMALATVVDAQPPATLSGTWVASPIWSIDLPQFIGGRPGAYASSTWPAEVVSVYVQPVSVNPAGIYEASPGRFYPPDAPQVRWSSFNAGEWLFPGSRASVLPGLLLAAGFAFLLWREVKKGDTPLFP